ncbi:unnamed protein product, partial [Brenthis ino]
MKCCVIGCKSYTDDRNNVDGNKVSFHSFPSDVILRNQWVHSINREGWTPSKYSKICSLHFDKEDIIKTNKGYKKIREGAYPKVPEKISSFIEIIVHISNQNQIPGPSNKQDLNEFLVLKDTPRKILLKEEMSRLKIIDKNRLIKLRRLRQNLRRLKKKVMTMESLITELKQKNLLKEEDADILKSMNVKVREIVTRTMYLYSRLVEIEKKLSYLTTHKLSQDHLELFFGIIRAHGRANNNPTARQFKSAYKKNLVQSELKDSFSGNCIPLEDLHILNMTSIEKINITADRCRMPEEGMNLEEPIPEDILIEFDEMLNNTCQNMLRRQVISYISGYVVRYITKKLKCETCLNSLYTCDYTEDHLLIKTKNKGGLIFPSYDVINICIRTECSIRTLNAHETVRNKHKVVSHAMKTLIGENCFSSLDNHMKEQPPLYNHITQLCKGICEKYVDIRFRHVATSKNSRITKRQHFNKTVLFTGD